MSRRVTIHCDECETPKTYTNHWFTVWIYYNKDLECNVAQVAPGIHFDKEEDSRVKHACGITHAITMITRFANNGTLDRDVPKNIDVIA